MFGAAASQALPSPRHAEVAAVGVDYHEFEPGFVAQLAYLARSNACSPFAAVLALIQRQLLERFGIRDIVIATDFAARSDQRLESLIGLFARQLPLPLRTVPNETFSDLARRTQGVIVEAIAAGDLGFAEISSCARDRGVGPPLFALKVVLEQGLRPALELPQLRVSYRADPVAAAKFPLLLNLSLDGDRLACRTEFDPAQIDAGFARTLAPSLSDVAAREFAAAGNNTSATARGGSGPRARYQRRPVALPNATALVRDREHVFPNLLSVFRPASAHADAPVLFAENRDLIREELRAKGAVLVRALAVDSAAELQRLSQSLFGSVLAYTERTSPRSRVDGNIYTSTDYPPEEKLPLHNENAYAASWPRWISFFCVTAPVEGGCTPLADIAEIYDALPGDVRDLFVRRGLQYVRNFNGPLGLSTEAAFGSSDTSAIDRMLRASGYGVERSRGRLTTRRRAPAVRMHPDHGMPVWFNHAHFFSITEKQLTERFALPGHELPTRVLYGDGEEIETRCVAALSEAYAFAERRFAWQKGDLLLLDNMRIAHGRDSFRPPRRIWVAMSEEISDPREDRT
jgi:alpha-ketoglutarate-dependent taurine dioxygenase